MTSLRRWLLLSGALLLTLRAPALAAPPPAEGPLKIYVLNVGQGDAILVVCPFGKHRMLIDTGASNYPGSQEAFQAMLTSLVGLGNTIDVVVASHPHADHIGGMHWVLSNFRVKKFIDNGKPYTSSATKIRTLANSLVKQGKLKYFAAMKFPAASVADFCTDKHVKAELLIPTGFGKASDVNDNSVVVLVTHGDVKLLFTGDAQKAEEKLLLADPVTAQKLANTTFYKIGHHGAETSTTTELVGAMNVKVAAASAGCKGIAANNGYRHPRALVLDRLQTAMESNPNRSPSVTTNAGRSEKDKWTTVTLREQIYVTGVDNTVVFESNGTSVRRVAGTVAGSLNVC
jgi:competence protein ComEC